MGDLLAKGSAFLERTRTRHLATEVVYVRGPASATVRATIGRSDIEQPNRDGLTTVVETRDYLILVADLVLDDIPVEPKRGDRIIEGDVSAGVVYQVMEPASQACWRWSDPYRTTYRIHAKYVGTQPPAVP